MCKSSRQKHEKPINSNCQFVSNDSAEEDSKDQWSEVRDTSSSESSDDGNNDSPLPIPKCIQNMLESMDERLCCLENRLQENAESFSKSKSENSKSRSLLQELLESSMHTLRSRSVKEQVNERLRELDLLREKNMGKCRM